MSDFQNGPCPVCGSNPSTSKTPFLKGITPINAAGSLAVVTAATGILVLIGYPLATSLQMVILALTALSFHQD